MQSYTIYEPRTVPEDPVKRAAAVVFVKDGFSFWAMLAAPFWLVHHRLWLALAGFVAAFAVLQVVAGLAGLPGASGAVLYGGLSVAFGVLANDIRRFFLERSSYGMIGAIAGNSRLECEQRFFANWSRRQEHNIQEQERPEQTLKKGTI